MDSFFESTCGIISIIIIIFLFYFFLCSFIWIRDVACCQRFELLFTFFFFGYFFFFKSLSSSSSSSSSSSLCLSCLFLSPSFHLDKGCSLLPMIFEFFILKKKSKFCYCLNWFDFFCEVNGKHKQMLVHRTLNSEQLWNLFMMCPSRFLKKECC